MFFYVNKNRLWIHIIYVLIFSYKVQSGEEAYFLDKLLTKKILIRSNSSVGSFCENVTCQAERIIKNKSIEGIEPIIVKNFDKSPASKFCISHKGVPGIVYDKTRNHVSICEFSDGSFFLTWDLLNKFKESGR